ncbi:MAG: hypothetical protein HUU55_21105 [Myxococcales bacterium]|nr:hypothetical protein [Myxococcales bacterium]
MSILNPLPSAYTLLILPLLFVVVAGRFFVRHATRDPVFVNAAGPLVGVVLWIISIHALARTVQSYEAGLVLGTALVSLLGIGGWLAKQRRPEPIPRLPRPPYMKILISSAAMMAVVSPVAFGWAFHDELFFTGHMSIAAQMQNGVYPPVHLTFPGFELRYHYAFSLLVANISTIFRVSLPVAIDVVTTVCFGYTFYLLWLLGNQVMGNHRGYLTGFVTLFAGGFPFFCTLPADPLAYELLGVCEIGGAILNPPMVSYFFQHPFTLGFPITATLLLLLTTRANGQRGLWWALAGVLLLALSVSQIVLFAAMTPIFLVVCAFDGGKFCSRSAGLALATVSVTFVLATGLGGFFLPMPEGDAVGGIRVRFGMGEFVFDVLRWHFQAFFVVLPLGLFGIWKASALRLPLALMVAGSLVLINTVEYTHSWDIAKFATVAAFALGIGASVTLSRLRDRLGGMLGLCVSFTGTLGCTFASLLFVGTFALDMDGIPQTLFHKAPQILSEDDVRIVSRLRRVVPAGQIVYRNVSATNGYAQWGGLAQPWTDYMVPRFGFSEERIAVRRWLLQEKPDDPNQWLKQRIRWFVLDTTKDQRLLDVASGWLRAGQAQEMEGSGNLRVFALNPPDT